MFSFNILIVFIALFINSQCDKPTDNDVLQLKYLHGHFCHLPGANAYRHLLGASLGPNVC